MGPSRGRSTCACQPRAETRAVDVVVATNEDIERYRGTPYDVIERHCTRAGRCMAAPTRGTDRATVENEVRGHEAAAARLQRLYAEELQQPLRPEVSRRWTRHHPCTSGRLEH